jgi:hypothetical protein
MFHVLTLFSHIGHVCWLVKLFMMKIVVVILSKIVSNNERISSNFKSFKVHKKYTFCFSYKTVISSYKKMILSRFMGDYRRGMDSWMDLLTTYKHHPELQGITAPSLISKLYISPQQLLSLFQPAVSSPAVSWQRLLTVEILQLHVLRSSCHSHPCRTLVNSTVAPSLLRAQINWLSVSLILRPTVSRPVFLGIKPRFGAYDQIFITFTQLRVCWYGAPSLTSGRVCLLQCTMYNIHYILLSQIWGQVPVFISPRNRVARLYPQAPGKLNSLTLTHSNYLLCPFMTSQHGSRRKHSPFIVEVFSDPLPRNGRPIFALVRFRGNVFTESLT